MKKALLIVLALLLGASVSFAGVNAPLKQVVLFTSGVGYFERVAEVTDADSVEMSFTSDQINDVIKSLVLIDEAAGGSAAVMYDSKDPLERTLKSFRINIADSPKMADFLYRARGVPIRITTAGEDLEGRVLGVEEKTETKDQLVFTKSIVNLATTNGIHSILLEDIRNIRILDEKVAGDLDQALKVLAGNLDRDKKRVHIAFTGTGHRTVRIGYMLEMPLWKTSYRLVLSEKDAFLQGWAHVENTTDDDWKQVRLSLVSGQPLSFIQNLYDPIYVKRPVVEAETFAGIVPPAYNAPVERAQAKFAGRSMLAKGLPRNSEAEGGEMFGDMGGAGAPAPELLEEQHVQAQAAGQEAGELFQYVIKDPVDLPRQRSAMLPILNESIKGDTLSVFNERVNSKFPLNGVEIENTSKLYLMRGPVTVFEGGVYAGDARLADTKPSEKKLLSYAVDLASEVVTRHDSAPEEIVSLKIVHGTLLIQRKYVDVTT